MVSLPSCVIEMVGSRKVTKVDGWSIFQVKMPKSLTTRLELCQAVVSPIKIPNISSMNRRRTGRQSFYTSESGYLICGLRNK